MQAAVAAKESACGPLVVGLPGGALQWLSVFVVCQTHRSRVARTVSLRCCRSTQVWTGHTACWLGAGHVQGCRSLLVPQYHSSHRLDAGCYQTVRYVGCVQQCLFGGARARRLQGVRQWQSLCAACCGPGVFFVFGSVKLTIWGPACVLAASRVHADCTAVRAGTAVRWTVCFRVQQGKSSEGCGRPGRSQSLAAAAFVLGGTCATVPAGCGDTTRCGAVLFGSRPIVQGQWFWPRPASRHVAA